MNKNQWVRQIHRWLSIAFTTTILAYIVAASLGQGQVPALLTYLPLLPLFLLLLTGLYLFALPYLARWRGGRRTGV